MKLDDAILEEIRRAGPGSRAWRVECNALNRLSNARLVYKVNNSPDRRVDEKVYSLSPDPIHWSAGRSASRF